MATPQSLVEVVLAVEAARRIPDEFRGQTFFGAYDMWQYEAIVDDRACEHCLWLDSRLFEGDELRRLFPYWEIIDADTIKTHSHMPRDDNCRCLLHRITYAPHYIAITPKQG